MASARHSMLALLGFAACIRALPAGVQVRQVLSPPKQSVTWDSGNPQPTPEESNGPALPPVLPPKPTDQFSLGSASFTVTWDGEGPTVTTTEPEKPTLPPGPKPSDQISLGTPSYWVSWDTGSSSPTPVPEEPYYPPVPPKDQFSIGNPSYWVSWEGQGPEPTPAPEEPEYPAPEDPEYPAPGQPTDEFSIGTPSYWVSWSGEGPKTPEPEPVKSSSAVVPPASSQKPEPNKSSTKPSAPASSSVGKTSSTKKPTYPEYPTWKPWPPKKSSTPKASSTPLRSSSVKPSPTPTPKPTPSPPKQSDQISLGTPSGWVSWDLANQKRQNELDVGINAYPTSTPKASPKTTSKKPKTSSKKPSTSTKKASSSVIPTPTPTPTPTPAPEPEPTPSPTDDYEPPQPSDDITLGQPSGWISWGKRDAHPQTEVLPPFPWPTLPNVIDISNPRVSVSWDKREAEPQADTIGLEFPHQTVWWPQPSAVKPPTYISWGKRQDEAEPTDVPELPEEPEDPEGPIVIPPFPVPTQPNSIGITPPTATVIWGKREAEPQVDTIGLEFPHQTVWWPQPSAVKPPTYISWGKRQDEAEPTAEPEIPDDEFPEDPEPEDPEGPIFIPPFPIPTQPNSIGIRPPTYTVIWGKRQDEAEPTLVPSVPDDDFPEDPEPEDPEGPIIIPPFPIPHPPNSIGISPPKYTVIWGKREAEAAAQANTIGLQFPTGSVIWEKPYPTNKPPVYVSWGKRQDEGLPTDILAPTPTNEQTIGSPQATVIWGRDAAPEPEAQNSIGLGWGTYSVYFPKPSSAEVIWGRDAAPEPTTPPTPAPPAEVTPIPIDPVKPITCIKPIITLTPVCAAPQCPMRQYPCDLSKRAPVMEKRVKEREIEKRVVTTVESVVSVGKPTPIRPPKCTGVTKTVTLSCPTYTCVPYCDPIAIVR